MTSEEGGVALKAATRNAAGCRFHLPVRQYDTPVLAFLRSPARGSSKVPAMPIENIRLTCVHVDLAGGTVEADIPGWLFAIVVRKDGRAVVQLCPPTSPQDIRDVDLEKLVEALQDAGREVISWNNQLDRTDAERGTEGG